MRINVDEGHRCNRRSDNHVSEEYRLFDSIKSSQPAEETKRSLGVYAHVMIQNGKLRNDGHIQGRGLGEGWTWVGTMVTAPEDQRGCAGYSFHCPFNLMDML